MLCFLAPGDFHSNKTVMRVAQKSSMQIGQTTQGALLICSVQTGFGTANNAMAVGECLENSRVKLQMLVDLYGNQDINHCVLIW
jgi:hypothetical protein